MVEVAHCLGFHCQHYLHVFLLSAPLSFTCCFSIWRFILQFFWLLLFMMRLVCVHLPLVIIILYFNELNKSWHYSMHRNKTIRCIFSSSYSIFLFPWIPHVITIHSSFSPSDNVSSQKRHLRGWSWQVYNQWIEETFCVDLTIFSGGDGASIGLFGVLCQLSFKATVILLHTYVHLNRLNAIMSIILYSSSNIITYLRALKSNECFDVNYLLQQQQ